MAGLGENLLKILGGDTNFSLVTIQLNKSEEDAKKGHRQIEEQFPKRKRQEIEVGKIRMYVRKGKEKIYTENIHVKNVNGFGVEMEIANNTRYFKSIKCGCCIYDSYGSTKFKKNTSIELGAKDMMQHRFFVSKEEAIRLKYGKYKVQIWMGSKKVGRVFFDVL